MLWMNYEWILILSFALIISLSGIIININKRGIKASAPDSSADNTLIYFRVFIPLALIASLIIFRFGIGNFDANIFLFCGSILLIISGIWIRLYAVRYLGKAFTVNIQTTPEQKLKTTGSFKYVRHPSYSGLLLYYFGLGLLMHNFSCLFILLIVPIFIVLIRIREEEKMLLSVFKEEYMIYQGKTKKLIPFIF